MTKLSFYISLALILVFMVITIILTGNSLSLYADIASLILAVLLPLIVLSFIYAPSEQMAICREVLRKKGNPDEALLRKALAYFMSMKKLMVYAGVFCTLIGAIGISAHLGGPEVMGANFGVLMIVPLYIALYLFMVLEPLRATAEKKLVVKGLNPN